jgi:glycosyltransferase involved in cell wall biosynthesis
MRNKERSRDPAKLTVANISQNYHVRGGSDTIFFNTGKLLTHHGHQVIPFAARHLRNEATEWSRYFPVGANFNSPGPRDLARFIYSRSAAQALSRLLDEHELDIAHLHIYYGKLTGSILTPLVEAGVPIVQTLHEYKLICPVYSLLSNGKVCEACEGHHFWRAIPRKCNRNSVARTLLSVAESYVSRQLGSISAVDHFMAVSDFVRLKMIRYGVPEDKISTVHNFIDCSEIVPASQPGGYFLYVGRLDAPKGILTLVKAAATVKDTPLFIVGEGAAYDGLAAFIGQHELGHIKLLGFKRGVALSQLIKNSLCLILPSELYETFGMSILEGFAYGRPAIASNIGGIPEVITNGEDGFLFEPGNVEALREKLLWMESHPRHAVEMGQAGRQKAETDFGADVYYDKIMQVYNQVLGARGGTL